MFTHAIIFSIAYGTNIGRELEIVSGVITLIAQSLTVNKYLKLLSINRTLGL